jgi:ribulose bisphosphate carboxylase small subunit
MDAMLNVQTDLQQGFIVSSNHMQDDRLRCRYLEMVEI